MSQATPNPSDDSLKLPKREGEPPRSSTEPHGAEFSARNSETLADPVTGAPNQRHAR